ncbi:DUF3429 domain-containing protein [Sphingomonas sp. Leaf33]|uniref:DUF3429 domain-containing protein n=1 Tax=Sphingomonas sp. Leaf33 TaxID=1736215 RepID=UPI001F244740|nr:DUF3429 domain-containing protein [Sphingomonas sp. Leaf33]
MAEARVGGVARLLGFAGLAPAVAATILIALGELDAAIVSVAYALLILSFLGGTWWGFAMHAPRHQAMLAIVAVIPSLVAMALGAGVLMTQGSGWSLVAIGVALILTLAVDRWLVARGFAPAGWMALRIPLSLGLGAVTIVAGALIGQAIGHP